MRSRIRYNKPWNTSVKEKSLRGAGSLAPVKVALLGAFLIAMLHAPLCPGQIDGQPSEPLSPTDVATRFARLKRQQMREMAREENIPVPSEFERLFDALEDNDWSASSNLWASLRSRAGQYEGSRSDSSIQTVLWQPVLETFGFFEQVNLWDPHLLTTYANEMLGALSPGCVYFGGTDPGRFVITAYRDVRGTPDIFVITQNALADNLYMHFLRNLYGDRIWIPSQVDSNAAFKKYIEGVRSGKIRAGADVKTEGGKVQVHGVAGVMKINGFLSQWIFEHNQYITETKTDEATFPVGSDGAQNNPVIDPKTGKPLLRTFYVEESYVLPWMYPYLTPNGLIMKINNKPTPLTPELIKNDTEFWNWNCDRLLGDEKFIRDIVARKTFSKLRSALAGLYAARGKPREAEAAFRQAIDLYDLSPEANMRLADLIARQGRFDEAIVLFDALIEKDQNNEKAQKFQNRIQKMKELDGKRQQLELKLKSGKIKFIDSMQLISIYLQTGQTTRADALAKQMLARDTITPPMLMQLAQHMARGKRLPVVEQVLKKYTEVQPADTKGWVNLAALQLALKKQEEMWVSINKAIEIGGEPTRNTIRTDKRFDSIRNTKEFQERFPLLTGSEKGATGCKQAEVN